MPNVWKTARGSGFEWQFGLLGYAERHKVSAHETNSHDDSGGVGGGVWEERIHSTLII